MSGGCGVNHATNCFRDFIPTHYSLHAFAQQMGDLLKVDVSEAHKLPKQQLAGLCGAFAVLSVEQQKQFSLCSAKLKEAIVAATNLCAQKTSAPPATTAAPPATTAAPPATTAAPPATTPAPPATTVAPPATTAAPPATTVAPMTTQDPVDTAFVLYVEGKQCRNLDSLGYLPSTSGKKDSQRACLTSCLKNAACNAIIYYKRSRWCSNFKKMCSNPSKAAKNSVTYVTKTLLNSL